MTTRHSYCCFNCDDLGGGTFREHEGQSKWWLGLEGNSQASYACDECVVQLFNAHQVPEEEVAAAMRSIEEEEAEVTQTAWGGAAKEEEDVSSPA